MVAGKTEGTMKIERVGRTCVSDLLDRIALLTRYVAPGFVGLFVWKVAGEDEGRIFQDAGSDRYVFWAVVAGAALWGLLIYALHMCFVARIIWRPLILRIHLAKDKHPWISNEQRKSAKAGTDRMLLDQSVSRLRRRISEDVETRSVQKGLDRWRAMAGFLYCSSYSMIVIPLLVIWPKTEVTESVWADYVVILGVLTLAAALVSDYIETWYELWAGATYKTPRAPKVQRRIRKSG